MNSQDEEGDYIKATADEEETKCNKIVKQLTLELLRFLLKRSRY